MNENQTLIDDCFTVKGTRWGTFNSYDKDGNQLVTALTEVSCVNSTRFLLKIRQEGATEEALRVYDGVVGGKL